MKQRILFGVIAISCLAGDAFAHGGGHTPPYNGPEGRVPPHLRPPGTTRPPKPPRPGGPTKPPGVTPTPRPKGATGKPLRGGGAIGGAGLTVRPKRTAVASYEDWDFWWAHNRAPWLRLKERLYAELIASDSAAQFLGRRVVSAGNDTSRPTIAYVREALIPELVKSIGDKHPDVADSACIALGKVGDRRDVESLLPIVSHRNANVRRAAVIALGLLESKAALSALVDLLLANRDGIRLRGGREPEYDLRAQAATAIGLILRRDGDVDARGRNALLEITRDERANRNIRINATVAMGLLRGSADELAPVRARLVDVGGSIRRNDFERAHAVIALGRLVRSNGYAIDEGLIALLRRLASRDRVNHVRRSATIALGTVLAGTGDAYPDAVETMRKRALGRGKGGSAMERNFAAIALGRIGGAVALKTLSRIARTERNQRGAYAALALAILAHGATDAKQASGGGDRVAAVSAIRFGFEHQKNPSIKGGFAIALGMARDRDAGPLLLKAMKKVRDFEFRGYAAVALGMIDYSRAVDYLMRTLDHAAAQPALKKQVAIALGLLGNRDVSGYLISTLCDEKSAFANAAITQALGTIGDRDSIRPLVRILNGADKHQDLTRGFACVALGTIGDDADIPTLSGLFAGHNYLASTSSLVELFHIL